MKINMYALGYKYPCINLGCIFCIEQFTGLYCINMAHEQENAETPAKLGTEKSGSGLDATSWHGTTEHIDRRLSADSITPEALGGLSTAELPKNYYWSYKFIGSNIVSVSTLISVDCS